MKYMSQANIGAYRRSIVIAAMMDSASAELEDDFHHLSVTLRHDGLMIEEVSVKSIRTPWTTCPAGAIALERLVGHALAVPITFDDDVQPAANCTHMLDLAKLASAYAHRPDFRCRYDIEVEGLLDRSTVASLDRDGVRLLDWRIIGGTIVGGPFNLRSPDALLREPDVIANAPLLEAVVALRRALRIAGGRAMNLDSLKSAEELGPLPASCHTLLPAIRPQAMRNLGATRNFSGEGRWPLSKKDEIVEHCSAGATPESAQ